MGFFGDLLKALGIASNEDEVHHDGEPSHREE